MHRLFVQPLIGGVVLAFLTLIGLELVAQAFGLDIERIFNTVLLGAIGVAILYHWQSKKVVALE